MLTQNWFHNLYIFPLTGKLAPLTRLNKIQKIFYYAMYFILQMCVHILQNLWQKIMVADVNSFTYIYFLVIHNNKKN